MKNPERVAALLAELRTLAESDFERHRIDVLERERAEAAEHQAIWETAKFYAAKIAVDSKPVEDNFRMCIYCFEGESVQSSLAESRYDDNRNVFDMLPTVDELNDVEIEADSNETTATVEAEMKAEFAKVEDSMRDMQTSLEIEICEGNLDNAQIIADKIVELNARYGHLYEQIYGHTVEIFTDPAQVIADAIEITAIVDEEQRKVFDETVAEINADKERDIAAAVADTMNADAPAGWKITPTKSGNFQILHGGNVEFVDTITAGDYLNPKEFFDQFRQTRAQEDDEREADLRQMKSERDQLIEMRDELAEKYPDDLKRLHTLNEMIDEHEDNIAMLESLLRRPPDKAVDFDKHGNVTHVWF